MRTGQLLPSDCNLIHALLVLAVYQKVRLFILKASSIQFSLLLLFGLAFSCNTIKEKPEPDFFSQTGELPVLNLEVNADSAEINVLAFQQINFPVSIEFGQPSHGSVEARSDGRKFLYKANAGFLGKDTIPYRICGDARCRNGNVMIEIKPDPSRCYPVYHPMDTQYVSIVTRPGKVSLPLFSGDVYCPGNLRTVTSSAAGVTGLSISDSIRFSSGFARRQRRSMLISYENTDKILGSKARFIRLSMVPDQNYCDSYFEVRGPDKVFFLERNDTLRISKLSLLPFVQVCDGDIDPDFFEVSASPNLGLIQGADGVVGIYFHSFPASPQGKLVYRFRNIRGTTDTALVRIFRGQRR